MSSTTATTLSEFVSSHRMRATRAFYLLFAAALLLTDSRYHGGLLSDILLLLGIVFIGLGTAGRLWCALFIGGHKRTDLTTVGPYSMTRNPLYFSSFLGFTGMGLATQMLLLTFASMIFFYTLYMFTIRQEERYLGGKFGEAFVKFCERTPRFFPDPKLYQEPETWLVDPKQFRRTMLDATWFVWMLGIIEFAGALHAHRLLPALIRLP